MCPRSRNICTEKLNTLPKVTQSIIELEFKPRPEFSTLSYTLYQVLCRLVSTAGTSTRRFSKILKQPSQLCYLVLQTRELSLKEIRLFVLGHKDSKW